MSWITLAAWLLITSVFLSDGPVLVATVGDRLSTGIRQLCLGLPLFFGPFALLLTPWAPWVALLIAAVVVLHLAGHAVWVRSLVLAPAPAEAVSEVVRLCAAWEVRPPDRVCVGPAGPAVIGLRRQVLVLPALALTAPAEVLQAMLAHELAHVAGRDSLRLWLAGVGRTLLFWHPLARVSLDSFRLQVELRADAQAAAWLGDSRRYALSLARAGLAFGGGGQAPAWGAALAERPTDLTVRLQTLLDPLPTARTLRLPAWMGRLLPAHRGERPEMAPRLAHTIILGTFLGYLLLFLLALWLS